MLSALCFLMAFGSSQTTEANCRSRTSSKSGLAWLWVGRVAGKLCLDGPPDLQDLGPGPGCDTRGFAALLLFLLYGGNWWGCVHWSTRLLHRAVEEPRGKKQTPYLILSSVFLCFLLTAIITTRWFVFFFFFLSPSLVPLLSNSILTALSYGFVPNVTASNSASFVQLSGSLVLLGLREGQGKDPSAVQGLGCLGLFQGEDFIFTSFGMPWLWGVESKSELCGCGAGWQKQSWAGQDLILACLANPDGASNEGRFSWLSVWRQNEMLKLFSSCSGVGLN